MTFVTLFRNPVSSIKDMGKKIQVIDFAIIWKKLHFSISSKDQDVLDNWLNESKSHQEFYNNVKAFYSNNQEFIGFDGDYRKALKIVNSKIHGNKLSKKRTIAWISSVASVIVILGSIIGIWIKQNEARQSEAVLSLESGVAKATLILDNGKSYDLQEGNTIAIDEAAAVISNQGKSLQYVGNEANVRKLKYNTLKVPRGGEFFVILSDSTKVWINSETTLKYPVRFLGNERRVELIGEAFFEVNKDTARPFRVVSGEQTVQALGTSFNISSYKEDSLIFTTLVDGKVIVMLNENSQINQILLPSYQSYLYKNQAQISQRKVNVSEYVAWKDGWFCFNNQSLDRMMSTLSKWYNVDVDFRNESTRKIKFTGTLKRYDNFEKVLIMLQKTHEIETIIEGRQLTIYEKN